MLAMLVALAVAATPRMALRVEVQPLGKGPQGTVVGVALQVAPEDLKRAGERLRVSLALVHGGATVDAGDAVVEVQPDGSAVHFKPPGRSGGIEGLELEVEAPAATARGAG